MQRNPLSVSSQSATTDALTVGFAEGAKDLHAIQRLRYDVFVREMGGDGALVDHVAGLEQDRFDTYATHLIVRDGTRVVGGYRLMTAEQAVRAGGFYSAAEYDLTPLLRSGKRLLELGRSCVHPAYRQGMALQQLWTALAAYIVEARIEVLFGVASFAGTDVAALAAPLSLLHHRHLAPEDLRVRARPFQRMDLIDQAAIDRRATLTAIPALIKAYLRLGGVVGEGAFIDHRFNTTDVCMILDTARMNPRQARLYRRGQGA